MSVDQHMEDYMAHLRSGGKGLHDEYDDYDDYDDFDIPDEATMKKEMDEYYDKLEKKVQARERRAAIDSFTVPGGKRESISFANGEYANLSADETPTAVTATDKDDNVHENRVLVSMKYATDSGDVVKWVNGTAQSFIDDSGDSDIRFVTTRLRIKSRFFSVPN